MLTAMTIDRTFGKGDYARLLDQVADHGLPLPEALRRHLRRTRACPVALALRRKIQLAYGPLTKHLPMARFLLDRQDETGLIEADPLATAAAAAAIAALLGHPGAGLDQQSRTAMAEALDRMAEALKRRRRDDGLFSPALATLDTADVALISAFILLMAAEPGFAQRLDPEPTARALQQKFHQLPATARQLFLMTAPCEGP